MGDKKDIRDERDRSRVSGQDDYELSYLEEKLNVSRDVVRKAIESVGNDREKVEAYILNERK